MRARLKIASLVVALALVFGFWINTPALAQVPVDIEVGTAPGAGLSWSVAETSAAPPVAYSFESQSTTGAMTATVTDSRGTEQGWQVSVSAPDFAGVANPAYTIPIANFVLQPTTVNVVAGQAIPLPVANRLIMSATPQLLMSAARNSGAGRYSVLMTGVFTIPGGTPVDTYATTLTVALVSAP